MHQTISGVTHKKEILVDIKQKDFLEDFLKINQECYEIISKHSNCLYDGKIIDSPILNYINEASGSKNHKKIKKLIINEYDRCEKIYPFLGELFIKYYHEGFDRNTYKGQMLNKRMINDLIKSLKYDINKNISRLIFEKFSMEYFVSIKNTNGSNAIIEKDNQNIFYADYDYDFFVNIEGAINNYRYLVVDGVIDTVGEIHHLLYKSSEDNDHYVVFCRGCHPEVKNTILKNNSLGNTRVYLVCFEINEMNINVLNDIAVIHDTSDIISSQKGQTISQETRKNLKLGKSIEFQKGGIKIKPVCEELKLIEHRNFIEKRISESSNEKNKEVLLHRYKNLQNKKLNIYIPNVEKNNIGLLKELNYILRLMTNVQKSFCKISLYGRIVFIPAQLINLIKIKLNSFKKTIDNIEYVLFKLE